ncbi:unnamed protein product [Parascedosporium putredinis]|uniref:non-specific serine/threonine protein kinase n=1 Tax=Parascedosporium putredinis TaxID=1442378 RepID=A0A9P1M6S7_9PEZI|nr:unnamed protein product [Parascedosporium putredinis]CAI7990262.1 unnamed protein product [Parascedosporium putredinis]
MPSSPSIESLSRYQTGVKFVIRPHTAPLPYGAGGYQNGDEIRDIIRGLTADDVVDRVEFALANPPTATYPAPSSDGGGAGTRSPATLTIVSRLDHHRESFGHARVVKCRLSPSANDSATYVAKIYDGAEYPLCDLRGYDCMSKADSDYSREAAAYEHMPPHLQGSTVPRYFGSWTFWWDEDQGKKRQVRMILLEYIKGDCMQTVISRALAMNRATYKAMFKSPDDAPLDYRLFPSESDRLKLLAQLLEAETRLSHAGVTHRDISARNVIISPSASRPERIILVDFANSTVFALTEHGMAYKQESEVGNDLLPPSPISRHWACGFLTRFRQWVPPAWLRDKELAQEWLCFRWWDSTDFQPLDHGFLTEEANHPVIAHYRGEREEDMELRLSTLLREGGD